MAYCGNIVNFVNDCSASRGGIKEILITNFTDGLFTASGTTGEITSVASGTTFYRFYVKKNTCSLTQTATIDHVSGVNFVTSDLALVFNKMETNKRLAVNSLLISDCAVVATDANGSHWVLGSEEPVNATAATGETGTAAADGNKYAVTLNDVTNGFLPIMTDSCYNSLTVNDGQ